MLHRVISRRDFLKLAIVGVGAVGYGAVRRLDPLSEFPLSERLGRVCVGMAEVKALPDQDSSTVGVLYEDAIVSWLREIAGRKTYYYNQRWVETPEGYIYSPYLQPVANISNQPVGQLTSASIGSGMWAEVTVPYVDVVLENAPSSSSWIAARIEQGLPVRLYYAQVFWIDRIRIDEHGQIQYRVNPNFYGGVDMLWASAEAFRPITSEEITPIHPEIEDKRIEIDLTRQSLSCYEGNVEVFYCRVSTGAKYDAYGNAVDYWSTPVGTHRVTRKFISLQMSGGTTGAGYDLPGIGWAAIFVTGGVAIHATVWHNDYGTPRSHGCVNTRPQDAKWIFRWTTPAVLYDPGMTDVTVTGDSSTLVEVIES